MYEPHYEEESGGGGFLIGLLCGTALGAAIALMFAPKAGSELRQKIYDSTGDIRRKAYETYGQASEQVNNMVTKGRQAVDRGIEAFDSARQAAGQAGMAGRPISAARADPGSPTSPAGLGPAAAHRTVLQRWHRVRTRQPHLTASPRPISATSQGRISPRVRHNPCIFGLHLSRSAVKMVLI